MAKCVAFKPVAGDDARVLILGTLPGAESLKRCEYYAKKENSFWKIMGELIGAFPDMPYEDRLHRFRQSGMALWDVCASAHRAGSLDSNIQPSTIVPNDFGSFFKAHRQIELICFNGQPAEMLFRRKVVASLLPAVAAIRRVALPSTSPAHARMRFERKFSLWREALGEFVRAV
jgi:TDG/mug DNA glycosylase family protein